MLPLPKGIESNFRYILIAAKRAEQLVDGARVRIAAKHVKPTTIALEELALDKVPWRIVTADEYELIKQQEIAEKIKEEQQPIFTIPIPVIPVIVEPEIEADEDELDDDVEEAVFDDLGDVDDVVGELTEELLGETPLPE